MKECDILGGSKHTLTPSYIFAGGQDPNPHYIRACRYLAIMQGLPLRFDRRSTPIRLQYDHSTTYVMVVCVYLCVSAAFEVSMLWLAGYVTVT